MIQLPFTLREEAMGGDGGGGETVTTLIKPDAGTGSTEGDAGSGTAKTTPPAASSGGLTSDPWWKDWVKSDGSLNKERLTHLPDELKGDKQIFDRFNKFDDFIKTFAHAQRTAREKGLVGLPEGATPEQETEFLTRRAKINGAPEKAEGYGIKRPDNVPEDLWNDDVANAMGKVFHARGFAPGDVKAVMDAHSQAVMAQAQSMETEQAKATESAWKKNHETLRNTFGPFLDERLKEAQSGAKYLGIDLNHPALTSNPEFQAAIILAAQKVASKISEAKFVDGGSSGSGSLSAKAQIEAMATDPANKYYRVLTDESFRSTHSALYEEAIMERRRLANQLAREAESRR